MDNETKISLSFKNSVTGEKKLEKYEERLENIYGLISGLNDSGTKEVVKKIIKGSDNVNKKTKETKNSSDKLSGSLKKAFNIGALAVYSKALHGLAKTFMQLSQKSTEYIENVNLLEVAYKNQNETIEQSSERIEKYIQKMADVYGLDESRLTRQFGIFKQLANAMQLPTETAENLSEIMVKMTNDIASLYNLDLNRASNALQSALAGQVRPIRSATGADITEKTLQNTVLDLGLDRTISELSYVEKRLIMVVSLTNQLKVSQGDYARTIESASNQIRVMHEQWDRLSRAVGNVFYPILENLLPIVNAVLMVLTEIANIIASLLGFKMPEFDYSGLSGVSDIALDIEDEMIGAGDATDDLANKLKGLRSFDKLNVINTPSASKASVGGGSVGGSGYVDPKIMDAFNKAFSEYDDKLDSVRMKASKIKDDIMRWLGFEKEINEETGKIEWKYQGFDKTIKNLWGTFKKLNPLVQAVVVGFAAIAAVKIYNGVKNLLTVFSGLTEKLGVGGLVGTLIGTAGVVGGFKMVEDSMRSVTEEGFNLTNTMGLLGGTLSGVLGGAMIGSTFGPWGAVIGGIAGGIMELGAALSGYGDEMTILVQESEDALQSVRDTTAEIQRSIAETEMEITSEMSLTNFHEQLLSELDTIIDANGKVKDGYEERAQYILNELSEAYGVEYQLIDGVLQESDKVKQSIKDQIRLKEAEILLEAYKKDYIQALKDENKLYSELNQAEVDRNIQLRRVKEILGAVGVTYEEYLAIQEKVKNGEKLTREEQEKALKISQAKTLGLNSEMEALDNYQAALDEATQNYETNQYKKMRYSDLATAIETGNLEYVDQVRDKYTKTWVKDGQVITNSEQTEANKRILNREAELKSWKNDNDERYQNYKDTLTSISKSVDDITPEIVEKWTALGNTSSEDFMKEFGKLPQDVQTKIVEEMYGKGHSISQELQRGLDSYDLAKDIKVRVDATNFNNFLATLNNHKISGNWFIQDLKVGFNTGAYASGGLPPVGQLFVANERGPELVSQIGGQSFVANQKQIGEYMDKRYGSYAQPVNLTMPVSIGGEKLGTIVLNNLQDLAKTNGQSITIG